MRLAPKKLRLTKFERLARKLKLDTEEALVNSTALRTWAKTNRKHEYVPEWLLDSWRYSSF